MAKVLTWGFFIKDQVSLGLGQGHEVHKDHCLMMCIGNKVDFASILDSFDNFYPAALKALGYCRCPSGRAAGQTSPVNTRTAAIFHRAFSNLAKSIPYDLR